MPKLDKQKEIEKISELLKINLQEAEDVFNYDRAIDHDEKTPHDLSPDKLKIAQKFTHTGTRKPFVPNLNKRERKPNTTKGGIITELANYLAQDTKLTVTDVTITNKERQIAFRIGNNSYELTLVQKRQPKK